MRVSPAFGSTFLLPPNVKIKDPIVSQFISTLHEANIALEIKPTTEFFELITPTQVHNTAHADQFQVEKQAVQALLQQVRDQDRSHVVGDLPGKVDKFCKGLLNEVMLMFANPKAEKAGAIILPFATPKKVRQA